jgi:hypothetical protein
LNDYCLGGMTVIPCVKVSLFGVVMRADIWIAAALSTLLPLSWDFFFALFTYTVLYLLEDLPASLMIDSARLWEAAIPLDSRFFFLFASLSCYILCSSLLSH